ncbi:MAG: DUF7318 family protein [Thermoplasmatota archaeon]
MAKKASGTEPGDVVRYDPAPEPGIAAFAIFILALVEIAFITLFVIGLVRGWNDVESQQREAFWLGSAMLDLAAILSLYRKFFLPDVMIVKMRKLKHEDLKF